MNKTKVPRKPLKHTDPKPDHKEKEWDLWKEPTDAFAMQTKILEGFPFGTLEKLRQHTGLTMDVVLSLVRIPARTLARRKVDGKLSPDESERVYRVITVFREIIKLFDGNTNSARKWFESPCRALGAKTPQEMIVTEVGAQRVLTIVGRLEYGVYT